MSERKREECFIFPGEEGGWEQRGNVELNVSLESREQVTGALQTGPSLTASEPVGAPQGETQEDSQCMCPERPKAHGGARVAWGCSMGPGLQEAEVPRVGSESQG